MLTTLNKIWILCASGMRNFTINALAPFSISSRAAVEILFFGTLTFLFLKFGADVGMAIPLFRLGGCDCGNSGDGSGGGSTPFLLTWNGSRFVYENDILFGKPQSFFPTFEEGKVAYESNKVTGDLYHIQSQLHAENGKIKFQIKEIEPEESFFDQLSLVRVAHPVGTSVFVGSDYKKIYILEDGAVKKGEGLQNQKAAKANGEVISFKHDENNKNIYEMQVGDSFEVSGLVEKKDDNAPLIFLLGSYYRDWTLGRVFGESLLAHGGRLTPSPYSLAARFREVAKTRGFARAFVLVALLGVASALSVIGGLVQAPFSPKEKPQTVTEKLAKSFGIPTARADTPHTSCSLIVEYHNGTSFTQADVIGTRYYRPSFDAIEIPKEAVSDSGEVRVRVTATKLHNVTHASFIAPKKTCEYTKEECAPTVAYHRRLDRDFSKTLRTSHTKKYMQIIPSDVVDVEFDVPEKKEDGMKESYLMRSSGYYIPASKETQEKLGNWVSRLDPQAREWLSDMYWVNTYHDKERSPILSSRG